MSPVARAALRWLPALLWMAIIFYWSSRSSIPSSDWLTSKAAHVVEYSVLGWLLGVAMASTGRWALMAWGISTLYALSDEMHQSFTPTRQPSAVDVLLDSAATALALLALALLLRRVASARRLWERLRT